MTILIEKFHLYRQQKLKKVLIKFQPIMHLIIQLVMHIVGMISLVKY